MVSRHALRLALLASAGVLCAPAPALAQNECPAPDRPAVDPALLSQRDSPDSPVTLDADQGHYDMQQQRYVAEGNAYLQRADQSLRADQIFYDARNSRADAIGNVLYRELGLELTGTEGYFYLDDSKGQLDEVQFRLTPGVGHGTADKAEVTGRSEAEFSRLRYSGCPEGDEDWWLSGNHLTINRDEGWGSARHAYLTFKDVPLLYTPYISFPIDDRRKTGVLPPRIGFSGVSGFDLMVPYYLNLAPNYDATLFPRYMSARGVLLGVEGRYLHEQFAASTNLAYLPHDRRANRDRWSTHFELQDRAPGPVYYSANLNRVSDPNYLEELSFERGLAVTSESNLSSQAILGYRRGEWYLQSMAQGWQSLHDVIAPQDRPYRILPRLEYGYSHLPAESNVSYGLRSEYTHFSHPYSGLVDTGDRLDTFASTGYRWERLAYYLHPTVGVHHTAYRLDRTDPALSDTPDRTLPLFNLDTGVFFERDMELGGEHLTQTLEPRLFYLYIPYRNQDELPLFDTDISELTLSRLFEYNRFTGPDRIGDANYLVTSVATRFLGADDGREHLRLAVGQAYYFSDRRVTLGGPSSEDTRQFSPLLGELRANVGDWTAYANYGWNFYEHESTNHGLRLAYRPEPMKSVNFAYRKHMGGFGSDPLELTEITAVWPVNPRWTALAGWQYSLLSDNTLERFVGAAYSSCCWAFRGVVREQAHDAGRPNSFSFMFQLELTGLGSLGEPLHQFVSEMVSGAHFQR